uniref:Link domain-containing protein n=1 Tax=Takifugu rubripes TaxID=31033 RepID=A0A3B5JYH7_TAKRU
MSRCFITQSLILAHYKSSILPSLAVDLSFISPKGVFLLPEGGEYSFSLSDAGAACLQLNATIASRAQVERALQLGLETCRFGWTADRIAVVPRLTADTKCGKGRTGVVPWATSEDQKFAVFCFDASGAVRSSDRPTAPPRSATDSSTLTSLLQTSTATEPPLTSWTGPPPPRTSTAPVAPPTQAFTLLLQAATSTSGKASSTRHPTSASQPTTSSAALVSSAFSTSVQQNLSMFSTNAPKASLAGTPPHLEHSCHQRVFFPSSAIGKASRTTLKY